MAQPQIGALALPATAQAQSETLVTNLSYSDDGFLAVALRSAQSFGTGDHSAGYKLDAVELRIRKPTGSTRGLDVKLYTESASGNPANALFTFPALAIPTGTGNLRFEAPAGTRLDPNTTYFIVFKQSGGSGGNSSAGTTKNLGQTGFDNWSIADKRTYHGGSWTSVQGEAYRMTVLGVAASTDATLSGLTVTGGGSDLVTFVSGTETYTASVASTVAEVTVTPALNDSNATIEYLDGDDATLTDAGTADGHQVTLTGGDNVIKVKVTASNGSTTKTYTVTVTRADTTAPTLTRASVATAGDTTALWFSEDLDLPDSSMGGLSTTIVGAFSVTVAGVGQEIQRIDRGFGASGANRLTVAHSTIYSGQTVVVSYDQSAASTDAIADAAGNEVADFTTGSDGVPAVTNGSTATPSSDATLSGLTVTGGGSDLVTFVSGTTSYTASVANAVDEVTVTAMTTDSGATIEYLDGDGATLTDADTSDPGHQVAVAVGGYVIQVKVTAADGNATQTYVVTVTRAADASNNAPVFSGTPTRTVPENSAAGTNVGAVIPEATDVDNDALTYSMEGTDATSFAFNASTRQITTIAGVDYNYEATPNSYSVTVTASDGTDSATVDVTIKLTDEDEQPDKPAEPTLAAVSGSSTRLVASWTEPGLNGGPEITGYSVEYREGASGAWKNVTHRDTGTTTTITGLMASTSYQVRVQALNGETPSAWSDPSDAVTPNAGVPGDEGVEGQFRLTPETVEDYSDDTEGHLNGHVGRAEVFHAGRWGTVSDDGLLRTDNEASALMCQAMGYTTGEFASGYGQPGPSQPFGPGITVFYPVGSTYPDHLPLPIWLDDLSCVSGDTDLTGENALKAPMAHCGYAGWGLHNSTHSEDAGVRCWNEPESDAGRSYDPLTAAFEGLPEAHDGETAFSFRLAFSEAVAVTPEAMRTRALTVAGGAVTGAARVDGESGVWEITVTPDSREDLSITLARTEDCEAEGAVCTSDGRTLSAVPAHIVPGPGPETEPALTASFEGLPEVHDGEEGFHFRVAFSEEIGIGFRSMRDDSFTVDGGEVTAARRVEGRHDLWRITVEPDSDEDVAIALPGGRECAVSGAICTRGENRRQLANTPTATVAGPPERNTAATGTPAIGGTAQVGEALTASTSGISDADGLDDARFAYQWIRASADIGGATGSTYTVVDADEGKRLKVRVSFTDDAGHEESLTSAATDAVTAAPELNTAAAGAPAIGGTAQVGEALTASTSGISDADGLDDARFAYQWIRTDTDIGGATDSTYTVVDADEGERLKVRVDFTDDAGNAERLTSAATDAVAAAPEPLTASFEGMPAEHRGQGSFSFRVAFSEGISISYKTVRDASFQVTAGEVTQARRVDGRRDLWKITIAPDADEAVTVRLPETTDCGASGAICTGDGRPLSHSLSATVAGPVGISVADARVEEGAGAELAFLVTLSRTPGAALTVDYRTADGSAHAGDDYRAASGTLTFGAGERSTTIEVAVLDDAHDEGEETLTLSLSNPSSGRVTDAEATGTIVNRDPLPRALLARFGRTAAVHVVEHVEERLAAPREPGFRSRFAGRELRPGLERDVATDVLRRLGGLAGAGSAGAGDPMAGVRDPLERGARRAGAAGMTAGAVGTTAGGGGLEGGFSGEGLLRLGLGGGDVLTGSGFALNRATRHGGILSLWSRGAQSRFSGREGALSLGGGVRTTMFGADYAKGPLTAGLSLSHSGGVGQYAGSDAGEVVSSVTGLYPWLGYQATERISVWGVAGRGSGALALTPAGGSALRSDLAMAMAAAGARGELLGSGGGEAGGFGLAFKADALWVGTSIDGVDGPAGRLAATAAAVSRVRTALEASHGFRFGSGLSLKPSVEVGVRRDGGDAETGAGVDLGSGLVVSAPSLGLSADVRLRMLVAHAAEEFRDRGVSVSLSYNPTPSTPFGLRARVAPSWGGQATSGAEALWGRETMARMAPGGFGAPGQRLDAEVGYGLPVGRRFVGTPRLGVVTSGMGRDYRLGYGLGVLEGGPLNFELAIDAQRREVPLTGGVNHGVAARASVRW